MKSFDFPEFVLILSLDGKKGKSKKTGKKGRKHRSKGGKEKASAVTASVKEAGDPKGGNKVPLKPNGNQAYKHVSLESLSLQVCVFVLP